MRYRWLALALALIGAMTTAVPRQAGAGKAPDKTTVIDRGEFGTEQEAVDSGGKIIVKGTFVLPRGTQLFVGRSGMHVKIEASVSGGTLEGVTIRQVRNPATLQPVNMILKGLQTTFDAHLCKGYPDIAKRPRDLLCG